MTAGRISGKIKMFGQLYFFEAIDIKAAQPIAHAPDRDRAHDPSRSAKILNKQVIAAKIQDFF